MLKQVDEFSAIVANPKLGFNRITGRLLCYMIAQAGGVTVLEKLAATIEDEAAEVSEELRKRAEAAQAILSSQKFLGKGNRSAEMSQDQAELLLELQPKPASSKPSGKPDERPDVAK